MALATDDFKSLVETNICAVSGAQYSYFWWIIFIGDSSNVYAAAAGDAD